MVITCSHCGRSSYGAFYPTDVKPAGTAWGTYEYDRYTGPKYCSETCRHADGRGPAPTNPNA